MSLVDDPLAFALAILVICLVVWFLLLRVCSWLCCKTPTNHCPDHHLAEVVVPPTRVDTCTCQDHGVVKGHLKWPPGDGDGFKFCPQCPVHPNVDIAVRLAGIDAPEMPGKTGDPGQAYAREARDFLAAMVVNKTLILQKCGKDQHGRVLAFAFLQGGDSRSINLKMVEAGLAEIYRGRGAVYNGCFEQLWTSENAAKKNKIGFWSIPNYVTPSQYKRKIRSRSNETAPRQNNRY